MAQVHEDLGPLQAMGALQDGTALGLRHVLRSKNHPFGVCPLSELDHLLSVSDGNQKENLSSLGEFPTKSHTRMGDCLNVLGFSKLVIILVIGDLQPWQMGLQLGFQGGFLLVSLNPPKTGLLP